MNGWAAPGLSGNVGFATREVNPPQGIYSGLWGAAQWDRSSGNRESFLLTAMYISAADAEVLIIAFDACAWRRTEDEWRLRSAVLESTGLPAERVLIMVSHTHSGPSLSRGDISLPGGELIGEYLDLLQGQAIAAAREAMASAQPARLEWARGSSGLASIRDLPSTGRYLTGWNPDESADDTVLVGRVIDENNEITGVLVNYGCHPTSLAWQSSLLSPDFVGSMRRLVSSQTGAPTMFLQGCVGDVAPREQYSGDPELAERHGRCLGFAVLAALEAMPSSDQGDEGVPEKLAAVCRWVDLPMKPVEDIDSLAARFWPELDDRARDARVRRAQARRAQAGDGTAAAYPVWVWQLGGAVLVAQPGELYTDVQVELRRRFPSLPVVVLSLTNGPIWTYFPRAALFDHNLYQVWHTPFERGGMERIIEVATEEIAALKPT